MNNVITFHPPKSALSLFYEVVGRMARVDGEENRLSRLLVGTRPRLLAQGF